MASYLSSVTPTEIQMIFRVFIPFVAIAVIGMVIGRWDECRHQKTLDKLLCCVFLPCLSFTALHRYETSLRELLLTGLAVLVLTGLPPLLGRLFAGRSQASGVRGLPPLFRGGASLLLPLAYLLFGTAGLAKAVLFYLFVQLCWCTLGAWLAGGRCCPGSFFRIPSLYAAALAMMAAGSSLRAPEHLQEFVWLFEKGAAITAMGALPLLIINFGYPLGRIGWGGLKELLPVRMLGVLSGPALAFFLVLLYRRLGWLEVETGYDILSHIDRRTTEAVLVLGASMPASLLAPAALSRCWSPDVPSRLGLLGRVFTLCAVLFFIDSLIFFDARG